MILIVSYSIWKTAERPSMILILYLLLFFSVNITQIRYGLGEAFILLSIMFLRERRIIKSIVMIIIAASFHITLLLFVSILLLYNERPRTWIYNNKRKIVYIAFICLIVFRLSSAAIPSIVRIMNNIGTIVDGNTIRSSANFAGYDGNHYLKYLPVPFLMLCIFNLLSNKNNN